MVVPKLDEQLPRQAARAPSSSSPTTLPERFGERAGEDVAFRVLVKEAKHKVLPELTDEWVDEASEFDTVDELRADIRKRLEIVSKVQAQMAVARQGARSGRRPRRRSTRPRRSSTRRWSGASKTSRTASGARA